MTSLSSWSGNTAKIAQSSHCWAVERYSRLYPEPQAVTNGKENTTGWQALTDKPMSAEIAELHNGATLHVTVLVNKKVTLELHELSAHKLRMSDLTVLHRDLLVVFRYRADNGTIRRFQLKFFDERDHNSFVAVLERFVLVKSVQKQAAGGFPLQASQNFAPSQTPAPQVQPADRYPLATSQVPPTSAPSAQPVSRFPLATTQALAPSLTSAPPVQSTGTFPLAMSQAFAPSSVSAPPVQPASRVLVQTSQAFAPPSTLAPSVFLPITPMAQDSAAARKPLLPVIDGLRRPTPMSTPVTSPSPLPQAYQQTPQNQQPLQEHQPPHPYFWQPNPHAQSSKDSQSQAVGYQFPPPTSTMPGLPPSSRPQYQPSTYPATGTATNVSASVAPPSTRIGADLSYEFPDTQRSLGDTTVADSLSQQMPHTQTSPFHVAPAAEQSRSDGSAVRLPTTTDQPIAVDHTLEQFPGVTSSGVVLEYLSDAGLVSLLRGIMAGPEFRALMARTDFDKLQAEMETYYKRKDREMQV
ncbi:hypothetical protein BDZ88DRAFT_449663 [Geranomyces variabilis]|nr:hypothetical protein BDZ88DRAFT_449663 [Geranomyces variabilis]KAJ3139851.1 hypothetical protein HDU90_008749 [Geranomyces variabilis]